MPGCHRADHHDIRQTRGQPGQRRCRARVAVTGLVRSNGHSNHIALIVASRSPPPRWKTSPSMNVNFDSAWRFRENSSRPITAFRKSNMPSNQLPCPRLTCARSASTNSPPPRRVVENGGHSIVADHGPHAPAGAAWRNDAMPAEEGHAAAPIRQRSSHLTPSAWSGGSRHVQSGSGQLRMRLPRCRLSQLTRQW